MRPVALAGILASTTILGGCAGTVAGVSLSSISSFAGFASTIFTGADLGEHAVSLVTGKDCRFSEGLMREDRDVCEEPGSVATRDDFHGIFIERIEADGTIVYAAPKYLPASVGAGENENNPDVIWAQIKTAKAKEESERQLARANASQSIDVAALASGSLSPQSLAFLPGGVKTEDMDGETASQTARSVPRPVVNAAASVNATPVKAAKADVKSTTVQTQVENDQPAIEEAALTLSLQAAKEGNGEGGPLFLTTTSAAPVSSTLINGEPVVILRLRPAMSATASSTAEIATAAAQPSSMPVEEFTPTSFTQPAAAPVRSATKPAPSPLAVLSDVPAAPRQSLPSGSTPTRVAAFEPPPMEAPRAKTKPAPAPIVQPQPTKPAREVAVAAPKPAPAKPAPVVPKKVEIIEDTSDVYQPPRELTSLDAPATVQVPHDVPSAALAPVTPAQPPAETPAASEPAASATGGPAPLLPMPQQ